MFDRPNILGSASLTPWQGPPSTLGEVFQTDWDVIQDQNLSGSNRIAKEEKYEQMSEQAARLFGTRVITPHANLIMGRSINQEQAELLFFEEIRKIFGEEPLEFNSPEEVNNRIAQERAEQRERQADVRARTSGPGAAVVGFAARSLALLSDPPVLLSSLVGASASAGILRTALIEAGIATAVEVPVQFSVQLGRRDFGEEASLEEGFENVVSAGAGGFLFGGAFRAAGLGFSNLRDILTRSEQIPNPSNLVKDAQANLRRYVEADEVNPLQRNAQGQEEHLRRFEEALIAVQEGRVVDLGIPKTPINRRVLQAGPVIRPRDSAIARLFKTFQRNAHDVKLIEQRRSATREALEVIRDDPVATERLLQGLRAAPEPVETLLGFLGRIGVDDTKGLLRRIGVTPENAPGVLREADGLSLNRVIGEARQSGFFPGRARVNRQEFLNAIERELSGEPVVRPEDEIDLINREVRFSFIRGVQDLGINLDEVTADEFSRQINNLPSQVNRATSSEKNAGSAVQVEASRAQEAIDNIDRTDALTENNFETTFAGRDDERVTITREDGTEEQITIAELRGRLNQDSEDVAALHICAGI